MNRRNLIVLLSVSLIIRLFFIFAVPTTWNSEFDGIQAFNDEASHVNYVHYLISHRSLPVQKHDVQEPDAFNRNEFEYYQPPLSYILTSLFVLPYVSADDAFFTYACRIVVCFMGLIGIFLFHQVLLAAGAKDNAFLLTTLYAFLPVHWRHTSSYSNDALLWIIVIILMYLIRKKLQEDRSIKYLILEGCVLGLGLWTKSSMITIVCSYIIIAFLDHKRWKVWIVPAVTGLLIASPYFFRNAILYHDFLGIRTSHGPATEGLGSLSIDVVLAFFRGLLGKMVIPFDTLNIPIYLKLPAYMVYAAAFGLFWVVFFRKSVQIFLSRPICFMTVLSLLIITAWAAFILYNWNQLQSEFRNIFYCVPIMLVFIDRSVVVNTDWKMTGFISLMLIYPLVLVLLFLSAG